MGSLDRGPCLRGHLGRGRGLEAGPGEPFDRLGCQGRSPVPPAGISATADGSGGVAESQWALGLCDPAGSRSVCGRVRGQDPGAVPDRVSPFRREEASDRQGAALVSAKLHRARARRKTPALALRGRRLGSARGGERQGSGRPSRRLRSVQFRYHRPDQAGRERIDRERIGHDRSRRRGQGEAEFCLDPRAQGDHVYSVFRDLADRLARAGAGRERCRTADHARRGCRPGARQGGEPRNGRRGPG